MRRLIVLSLTAAVIVPGIAHSQAMDAQRTASILVDGVPREWRMYVPASYSGGVPKALVIDFHGTGASPDQQAALSQFEVLAEEEGFLVATPAGEYLRPDAGQVSWNVYRDETGVDDVQFVRELIETIRADFSVDPARIYAAGMSGGGRMSSRVACDLSDVIAAIAPVTGIQFPAGCNPTRPVPVITFHGKLDGINHYDHRADSPPYWDTGVETSVSRWAAHNRCEGSPDEEFVTPQVARISYSDCAEGSSVVFYRSENAGHTWPGSPRADRLMELGYGVTDRDLPATRLIWEFFTRHPLYQARRGQAPRTGECVASDP